MVFFSYSREDARLVEQLEYRLRDCGVPICKDIPQAESDPFWRNGIARLLQCASVVLVFWTKYAYASPFVDQEIRSWSGRKIFFRYDQTPVLNYSRTADIICEDWKGLLNGLRSCVSWVKCNRTSSYSTGNAGWRREVAYTCAQRALEAFRRRTFAPLELVRLEEGLLQDTREGNLFRKVAGDIYIATRSVTHRQYSRFIEEMAFPVSGPVLHGASSEDLPIGSISWYEALTYCEWFGGSLPSEAEWQLAASTDRSFRYATATGDIRPSLANYGGNLAVGAPVRQEAFPPNPDGFFGLCGNTWDWCSNRWGNFRVIKGGSWMDSARFCAVTSRYRNAPVDRDCSVGFRVRLLARCKGGEAYEAVRTTFEDV
jgi:hypothetical protein